MVNESDTGSTAEVTDKVLMVLADLADARRAADMMASHEQDLVQRSVDRAMELREEGHSVKDIAEALGITPAVLSVRMTRRRKALTSRGTAPSPIEVRNDQIVAAYEQGHAPKDLAIDFGVVPESRILQILQNRGVKLRAADRHG